MFTSATACRGDSGMGGSVQGCGQRRQRGGVCGVPVRTPFSVPSLPLVAWLRGSGDVTVPQTLDRKKHAPWSSDRCTPSPWPLSNLCGWPRVAQSERRSGKLCCQKDVLCFLPDEQREAEAPGAARPESGRESDVEANSREGSQAHGEKLSKII